METEKTSSRLFVAFLTLGAINLFAQNEKKACLSLPLVCAIKTAGGDVAYVFTSRWRTTTRGGVEFLALSALTTGFILRADNKIDQELGLENYEFHSLPFRELPNL